MKELLKLLVGFVVLFTIFGTSVVYAIARKWVDSENEVKLPWKKK